MNILNNLLNVKSMERKKGDHSIRWTFNRGEVLANFQQVSKSKEYRCPYQVIKNQLREENSIYIKQNKF